MRNTLLGVRKINYTPPYGIDMLYDFNSGGYVSNHVFLSVMATRNLKVELNVWSSHICLALWHYIKLPPSLCS